MESELNTYALITGGSSGIGKALAIELASRGYDIAIVALPNTGQEQVRQEIKSAYNVKFKSLELNILEKGAISQISAWVISEQMNLQILVNNAGIGYAAEFDTLEGSFISTVIDLNIKATTLLSHAMIPFLKKRRQSYILNLSSAAAFYSMPYKSVYAASKRYVLDFSSALREELSSFNIGVTAVCPAGVITSPEIKERIKAAGYMARISALEPSQVAKESVNAMIQRKAKVIPGKMAKLISCVRFIIPPRIQRKIIAKNFKKAI